MTAYVPARRSTSLPAWLEVHAEHRGERVALLDENGEVTYRELAACMYGVAGALLARGLRPGDRLVTAMAPSLAHVLVILGCLRAGVVVTPLNTRLAPVEARTFLGPVAPRLTVTDVVYAPLAGQLGTDVLELPAALEHGSARERLAPLQGGRATLAPVDEDAPAIIFPTGGTTGMPKGAYYDQRGVWMWLNSVIQADPHAPQDRDLFCLPFFHVSLGVVLLSRLLGGGTVRIQRGFEPADVLRAFGEDVTRFTAAPTMLAALRAHPDFAGTPRDGLRRLTFGSSPASEDFIAQVLSEYPGVEIRTAYGATEIGPVTGAEHADFVAGRLEGVGRPLPGVRIRVVDEDGRELPRGEIGELVVASPWQTLGYYANPEESARTFVAEGVRTGDLGYLEHDSWLCLAGRRKDVIISGGENVFPVEVEAVLGKHPDVEGLLVYGMPDDYWGERVEVAVVPRPGCTVELEPLRAFGRRRLAGYKLPRGMRVLDAIPVTANNKPDRRAVREQALAAAEVEESRLNKEIV